MNELVQNAALALERRGFSVLRTATAAQAREALLSLIQPGDSIGIGGSMTIRELNVIPELEATGHEVWWHWSTPADREMVQEHARKADVYLASSNAITKDGQLVNIDGTCNRIASMIQGPRTVILVVSEQKIVDGGLNTAIARIRKYACPPNAKRLNYQTPCGLTGVCNQAECGGEDCMCRCIAMLERPIRGRKMVIILVEEAMGF